MKRTAREISYARLGTVFMLKPSGKERRLKPRFEVGLPCSVSLPASERDMLFPNEKLECRTRDLSESGVGLVAPSIYLGYSCIVDEGRTLELSLELPTETVRLMATAAHYLRLDSGASDASYLIGLRIVEVAQEHRAAFLTYLDALASAVAVGTRSDEKLQPEF